MRILIWLIMIGSCVGSICYQYQQEINGIYNQQINFEVTQELLNSSSF